MLFTIGVSSRVRRWAALLAPLLALLAFPTSFGACDDSSGGSGGSGEVVCGAPNGGTCAPSGANQGPGCKGRRWIGYLEDGLCAFHSPLLDSKGSGSTSSSGGEVTWDSGPLFGDQHPGLAGYCLYTFVGAGDPDPTDVAAFQKAGFAEDCVSIGTAADPPPQEVTHVRAELKDNFFRFATGLGAPSDLPPLNEGKKTAVAVVDTQTKEGNFTNNHGAVVSGVINDLACGDGGPCLVETARELGLAYKSTTERDEVEGGSFGTPGELAVAIFQAIEHWKISGFGNGHPRLVVNLSVGWQPGNDCGANVNQLSCSARAVYDVLRYAACEGVLVVAAAGNSPGGLARCEADPALNSPPPPFADTLNPSADIEGATCPGAWTAIPAPSEAECNCLVASNDPVHLLQQAVSALDDTPTPLLVAVAGVDYTDEPLSNARGGARPPYAALGVLATTEIDGNMSPPISGSSIGAAVWSAIAASTWAYSPTFTRGAIIDRVFNQGRDTGLDAQIGLGSASGLPLSTRRALLCSTIDEACTSGDALDTPIPLVSTNLSSLFTNVTQEPAEAGGAWFSEMFQATEALPWVHPQPERPPCGVCGLQNEQLSIYVNPEYTSQIMALTVQDKSTQNRYHVSFQTPLLPGAKVVITDVPPMASPELSFLVQGPVGGIALQGSVTQQPLVLP